MGRAAGLLAALVVVCALADSSRATLAQPMSGYVTRLGEVVRYLADPAREGRGVGTRGLDDAAAYIADRMRAAGLLPGGDRGTYLQALEVTTGVEVGTPNAVEVGGTRVDLGDAFQPIGFSTNGTVRAPVVFAGYGISAPGFQYDDFEGLDVRDKLVLVMTNEPGEMDTTSRFDGAVNTPHAELRTKAIAARERGALGILVVNGPKHHAGEPLPRPRSDGGGYMTSGLIAARISEALAERLMQGSGRTLREAQEQIEEHGTPHSFALAESATVTVALRRTRATTHNVVGWIPGRDTTRTLVIGAHYDHLGFGGESSLTPDARVPHVGADDNASGVAAMLDVATRLLRTNAAGRATRTPRHNLVFVGFTAEESGLIGSSHFVDAPPRPLETVEAMINFDMVGRLRENRLMVMGVGTATELAPLLRRTNRALGRAAKRDSLFVLRTANDGYGPSDHSSFYKRNVPVLMFFTGAHADYHKPTDTPDKVDFAGLERIAGFAAAVVESLDARPKLTFVKAQGEANVGRIAGGGGYGAWLGTIPDYVQTEGGVLLSGVRAGSPAEQAGLAGGDVIVQFDGVRVDNIYDYTFALRSRKPGQDVRVTVKRGGAERVLVATLGRRP
jgi:aminopeptidase YwaD